MTDVVISSEIAHTHRSSEKIQAWQYRGQKFANWPDWVRSHFQHRSEPPKPGRGTWAIRDDDGFFWRWLRDDIFQARYEALQRSPQEIAHD